MKTTIKLTIKAKPLDVPLEKIKRLKCPVFNQIESHQVQIVGADFGGENCVFFSLKE